MSDKTLFTTIDMRNAKYQGAVKQNAPQGMGFLLNVDHQLTLTHWTRQDIQGPTIIVYPNRNYLYGQVRNKRLEGIVTYHKGNGQSYHFNFINGVTQKLAHDQNNGVVTELTITEGKMTAGQSEKIKNNNKWQIVSRILGIDLQLKHKGVKNFMRDFYEKEQPELFECSQSSGLTYLGFKNTGSLGVKFDKHEQVSQVGFFEAFPQNIEFGRKYTSNPSKAIKIEQGRFASPQKLFTYQRTRPAQAIKFTEQYFKCGTTFKNIFFKAPVLEDIETYLQSVEKQIAKLYMLQYGQRILERDKVNQEENYQNKEYTIDEVKKDIYAKLDRRNHGGRRSVRESFRDSRDKIEALKLSRDREKLTPSKKYGQLYREIGSEPRDLQSSKRTNKRYLYTEVVKDQLGATHSPIKYQRSDDKYRQPQQFNIYQQSPPKNKPYVYSEPRKQEHSYLDSNRTYRNNPLDEEFTFKNRREEPFFGRSPLRAQAPRTKIIHQPSGQHFVYEPKNKYAYVSDSSKSRKSRPKEPFTLNSAQSNKDGPSIEHYLKYKNRNRTPTKQEAVHFPKRYDIYQPQPGRERQNDPQREIQMESSQRQLTPIRHKKYFKYL